MAKITNEEKEKIKKEYLSGKTYRELSKETGICQASLSKFLKGLITLSESSKRSHKAGKNVLSDKGRQKLRESGIKLCQSKTKCWTKPEQQFKDILNEMGIGVKFPDYIKDMFGLTDDPNPEIKFQFPVENYVCDFVDENRRIVYAVNGDFWHGNPLLYNEEDLRPLQKKMIVRDRNRNILFERRNWLVCEIWECEIKWNKDLVKQKIEATRANKTFEYKEMDDWSNKLKELWIKKPRKKSEKIKKICCICNKEYYVEKRKESSSNYCSTSCYKFGLRRTERPSKEELHKLLWEIPTSAIAERFGVSSNAIGKWAKSYNIDKPPRGHWKKIQAYQKRNFVL